MFKLDDLEIFVDLKEIPTNKQIADELHKLAFNDDTEANASLWLRAASNRLISTGYYNGR